MEDGNVPMEGGGYRDNLATVDKRGKRIWLYPKMPKGKFYNYRKVVSYGLLIILFGLPWISWNDQPIFLFNILKSKFILFGVYFAPHDFHIFVIAMLIFIVFIALFTVIFGRVFCGWVCPQTIFMEMVYRRIEYWIEGDANAQRRLDRAKWHASKVLKKMSKQIIFFVIAVLIANTFLAYIIGIEEVIKLATDPISEHYQGFSAMIIFSLVFYFVFARLREQVCTTICPYGRLQGVLLDNQSLAVQYDHVRGEQRGKLRKNVKSELEFGDCIDCSLCVQVCPTGIDIRDGIQLECVNCTACMDACDEVMTKIDRPTGLIRIDSTLGISNRGHNLINKRSIAYTLVLSLLIVAEGFLMIGRSDVEILLLRVPGMTYQKNDNDQISNLYNYQLINKTTLESPLDFEIKNVPEAIIEFVGESPKTKSQSVTEGTLFIKIPRDKLSNRKTKILLSAYRDGKVIETFSTTFFGPI